MTTAQGDSDGAVPEPAPAGPPVYRGDLEHRGEYQDIVPKSFWTGFTDTAFFIFNIIHYSFPSLWVCNRCNNTFRFIH